MAPAEALATRLGALVTPQALCKAYIGAEKSRNKRMKRLQLQQSYAGDSPRTDIWAEAFVQSLDALPKRISRAL
eukprot:298993-Prorocentrum_lima.AAC.1